MKPSSILLFVGALLLAVAVLTPHWIGYGDSHGGLVSSTYCRDSSSDCDTEYMIRYIGKGIGARGMLAIVSGILTLLGGLAAVVLGCISGVTTMNGKRGPSMVALILAGVTLFLGIVYTVLVHGTSPGMWGYSLFLFVIGGGLVVGGSLMAMSAFPSQARGMMMMRPGMPGMPGVPMGYMPQPGYAAPQMQPPPQGYGYAQPPQMQGYPQQPPMQAQQPQQPACNQCGGATVWNGNVGKLFCGRCNRFLV
jgi:hypothetical protein